MSEHEYELLLRFDTDNAEFVRGFEAGRLWESVKANAAPFSQIIHAVNAEMAMRIAEAEGRRFSAEIIDDTWVEVSFE